MCCPSWQASGKGWLTDTHHELAELFTRFESREGITTALEREHAVHGRSQPPTAKVRDHARELRVVAHRRAENAPLIPEELADVGGDHRPGGSTARNETP